MKTNNVNTAKTYYQLEESSLDLDNFKGVLLVKPEEPKNGQWKRINVSISPYLASIMKKQNNHRRMMIGDTWFSKFLSTANSKQFHENPYKLVKYVPGEGSDIPVNYRLELVNEKRGVQREFEDLFENKFTEWQNRKVKVSKWRRYIERTSTITMKEAKAIGVNIVE